MDAQTQTERAAAHPHRLTFGQHVLAFTKELLAVVIGAVIVSSLLRGFVGQMFVIPSTSMLNTLRTDDRVVVEKISTIKRGQVVVFEDPGGWLSGSPTYERGTIGRVFEFIGVLPDASTEHLIKRAIGLPGDRVVCCDAQGRLTVNDHPLQESGYLYVDTDGTRAAPSEIRFDVVVPANHIFVMGDNRANSRDSRCHLNDVAGGAGKGDNAFVPLDLVVGRTVGVAWPFSDARRLAVPATFDGVPEPKPSAPARAVVKVGPEASC